MLSASRYELLDRIAIGGMAELFRARILGEHGFYKILAVKRILPQFAGDEVFVKMLVDEARTASHLSHPSIAAVYELRRDADGGLFIAMEFVNGPSLAALLRKLNEAGRHLPLPCALDVAIHLLEALDYAHHLVDAGGRPLGLVHRDVSPDNVLIGRDGSVKLTDFGVAKARGRMTQTQQGTIKGKLAYMSPEQVRGQEIDGRADLFAGALVAWEALCGRPYYDAEGDYELMRQVAEGRQRTLAEAGIEVPPEVEAALAKALSVDPAHRHSRAGEFARELAAFHRRTFPDYTPDLLAQIVEEHFADRFQVLAERLRGFENGIEKPFGLLSPAPGEPDVGAAADAVTDPGAASPPPRRHSQGQVRRTSQQDVAATRQPSGTAAWSPPPSEQQASVPTPIVPQRKASRQEVPRKASKAEVPKAAKPPHDPKKPAPKVTRAATPADDQDKKAIDAALAQANKEEKAEKKGVSVVGILGALVAFGIAAGGGILGLQWLEGEEAAPPPQALDAPLVVPDPKNVPEPPKQREPPKRPVTRTDKPEKPADKPADKPVADGRKGRLDLECEPADQCEVEIDGRKVGVAPLNGHELPVGEHKVRVSNRALGASKVRPVEITAGVTTRTKINLFR